MKNAKRSGVILVLLIPLIWGCAHNLEGKRSSVSGESLVFGKFSKLTFNGIDLGPEDCQVEVSVSVSPQLKSYRKIPVRPGQIFHFSSSSGRHEFSHLACSLGANKKAYIFELNVVLNEITENIHYIGEFSFEVISPRKAKQGTILTWVARHNQRRATKVRVVSTSNPETTLQNIEQMRAEYPQVIAEAEKRSFRGPLQIEISSTQRSSIASLKSLGALTKRK